LPSIAAAGSTESDAFRELGSTAFSMSLHSAPFLAIALLAVGAAIALLGLRHVWQAGAILRAPAAGDPDAADAPLVRYEGTLADVADEDAIEAPFSGVPSVVVRHVVEERQLNPGVPILQWDVVIEEDVQRVPFEIRTPDASATVDGAVSRAILGQETVATVGVDESSPERIAAFTERLGLRERPLLFGSLPGPLASVGRLLGLGRRTYSEERLEVGEDVVVIGHPVGDGGDDTSSVIDPLIVSDRSPRRTFFSMAKTGLVAGVLGSGVVALGLIVLLV
jgi:hypothetical protein